MSFARPYIHYPLIVLAIAVVGAFILGGLQISP